MPSRSQSRARIEILVGQIEENQDGLAGLIGAQTSRCKDEAFPGDKEITAAKIKTKYYNMKQGWHRTYEMARGSRFSLTKEDYTNLINRKRLIPTTTPTTIATADTNDEPLETLEKKCPFYQRLNAIFGSKPNTVPILTTDTILGTGDRDGLDLDITKPVNDQSNSDADIIIDEPPTT